MLRVLLDSMGVLNLFQEVFQLLELAHQALLAGVRALKLESSS